MLFDSLYFTHFLWTYYPPDAVIPNEIDLNIIVGVTDRRRQPRVQEGRTFSGGLGVLLVIAIIRQEKEKRKKKV